jgi:hypothetical protein
LYRIPIAICVMSNGFLSHGCRGGCRNTLCEELGIHIATITVIGHIYPNTITIFLEIDLCPLRNGQDDSTGSAGINPQTQISGGGSYYAFCKGNKGSTNKQEYYNKLCHLQTCHRLLCYPHLAEDITYIIRYTRVQ